MVASTGEPYIYAGGNPISFTDPSGLEKGANEEEKARRLVSPFCMFDATACRTASGWLSEYNKYIKRWEDGRAEREEARAEQLELVRSRETDRETYRGGGAATGRPVDDGWTVGVSSGFCIFFCLEAGLSGDGPYIKPGIGFAVDSPSIVIDSASPECGSEETVAYVSGGVGPSFGGPQFNVGARSADRSGDWENASGFSGFGLPDGGAAPGGKLWGVGGGVVHTWAKC